MTIAHVLPSLLALLASTAAIATLAFMSRRIGGQIGRSLRLVVAGVFFSVFLHAGAELADALGLIPPDTLLALMAGLVTLGSVSFFAAGILGVRALR